MGGLKTHGVILGDPTLLWMGNLYLLNDYITSSKIKLLLTMHNPKEIVNKIENLLQKIVKEMLIGIKGPFHLKHTLFVLEDFCFVCLQGIWFELMIG